MYVNPEHDSRTKKGQSDFEDDWQRSAKKGSTVKYI